MPALAVPSLTLDPVQHRASVAARRPGRPRRQAAGRRRCSGCTRGRGVGARARAWRGHGRMARVRRRRGRRCVRAVGVRVLAGDRAPGRDRGRARCGRRGGRRRRASRGARTGRDVRGLHRDVAAAAAAHARARVRRGANRAGQRRSAPDRGVRGASRALRVARRRACPRARMGAPHRAGRSACERGGGRARPRATPGAGARGLRGQAVRAAAMARLPGRRAPVRHLAGAVVGRRPACRERAGADHARRAAARAGARGGAAPVAVPARRRRRLDASCRAGAPLARRRDALARLARARGGARRRRPEPRRALALGEGRAPPRAAPSAARVGRTLAQLADGPRVVRRAYAVERRVPGAGCLERAPRQLRAPRCGRADAGRRRCARHAGHARARAGVPARGARRTHPRPWPSRGDRADVRRAVGRRRLVRRVATGAATQPAASGGLATRARRSARVFRGRARVRAGA